MAVHIVKCQYQYCTPRWILGLERGRRHHEYSSHELDTWLLNGEIHLIMLENFNTNALYLRVKSTGFSSYQPLIHSYPCVLSIMKLLFIFEPFLSGASRFYCLASIMSLLPEGFITRLQTAIHPPHRSSGSVSHHRDTFSLLFVIF